MRLIASLYDFWWRRWVPATTASFFSAAGLCLGFFWAGWDRQKQSWHDKIASTVVVRVPKGASLIEPTAARQPGT
jgi:uncharacterized RDD family membrane protein YckC